MRCTIVLEFDDGNATAVRRVELMRFHRANCASSGDVGLSLTEGKSLVNRVQQEFVEEQVSRYCASQQACKACGALRRVHDGHSSELKTTLGKVFYCRDRWQACKCGADRSRYVSPLKNYIKQASTGELRWLHAELDATMPYRQAKQVMDQSGKQPRVWASAMPRTKRLHEEMMNFLEDSGYNDPDEVCVVTDGARDLAGVADNLPFDTEWVLDWAHIGRMMRHVDQA